MKNIILGCFGSITFKQLQEKYSLVEFKGFIDWKRVTNDYSDVIVYGISFLRIVKNACIIADEIYFDITHLYLPFSTSSVTLCELDYIMNNYEFLSKTRFFINGNEIDKKIVVEQYWKNVTDSEKFYFDSLFHLKKELVA